MAVKAVSFRLSESDIELVKFIAERRGETQADAIRFCIRCAADEIRVRHAPNASTEAREALVELLREQVAAKDEQIRDLSVRLDAAQGAERAALDIAAAAQENAKAAQILHAQERAALESAEQKAERRWRWPWQRG